MHCESKTKLRELLAKLDVAQKKHKHGLRVRERILEKKIGRGDTVVSDELKKLNRNLKRLAKDRGLEVKHVSRKAFQRIINDPMAAFHDGTRKPLLNLYQQVGLLEGITSRADK